MSNSIRLRSCTYTLTLALGMSALAAGGIHLPVLAAYAALLLASGALAMGGDGWEGGSSRARWAVRLGVGLCTGLCLLCLVQALPLPVNWLRLLAPQNADIWARARQLFETPAPGLESLSLAPRRSLVEALKYASYALVFGISAMLSRKLGSPRLTAIAFGLAVAVATVTAAHQVVGAERLYGFYEPLHAYSIAPLLNANNRAGYLNLGFFCGLGVLFRAGRRPYAALVGLALAFLAAEILMCQSLGGSIGLGVGLLGVLLLRRGSARSSPELGRWLQAGVLLAVAAGAVLMAVAARRSPLGLDDHSTEKLDLLSSSARLAFDHPWFGVGRGAFGSVFPAYQSSPGHVVSEHAENFAVQWAAEWGFPAATLALVALGLLFASLITRRALQSPSRRCALVGCAVLLLQNLVDLGLEVPAVAALFFCVLGNAAGAAEGGAPDTPDTWPRWVTPGLCGACLVLALGLGVESQARLRHDLYTELDGASGPPPPAFWTALERAVSAYPGDFYLPLLASSAALAAGQNPLPWISRALERNPASAEAHVQLARVLLAHHRTSQGLGALRRALELDPRRAGAVPRLAGAWQLSEADLEKALPEGKAGIPLLMILAARTKLRTDRVRLLEQVVDRDPEKKEAHYQLASELWAELSDNAPERSCALAREECLARVKEHTRRALDPNSPRAEVLQARLLAEQGEARTAEELMAKTCDRFPSDPGCREMLVSLAIDNRSPRLNDAVNALVAAACVNSERCGKAHTGLGRRFTRAGDLGTAMNHFRRAAEEAPSHRTLTDLAKAAERLGHDTLAEDARRRLELLKDDHSKPASPTPAAPASAHPAPPGVEPEEHGEGG
jgi:tetratricopeptide (TPR) repeat protein